MCHLLERQSIQMNEIQLLKETLQQKLYDIDCKRIPLQDQVNHLQNECNKLDNLNKNQPLKGK